MDLQTDKVHKTIKKKGLTDRNRNIIKITKYIYKYLFICITDDGPSDNVICIPFPP